MTTAGLWNILELLRSWNFLSCSDPCQVWFLKVYYYFNKCPPLVIVLSQINLVCVQPSHIVKIHFSVSMPRPAKWCLSFIFPTKTVRLSSLPYMAHPPFTPPSISSLILMVMMLPVKQVVPCDTFCLHTNFFMVRRCQPLPSLQAGASRLVTYLHLLIQHCTYLPNVVCHDVLFSLYSLTYDVGNSLLK